MTASSLVASVGNRDQWKNNRSAVLNGNAIESEALLKLRDRAYESGTVEESETMIKLKSGCL
jgi:hypothetical protein